VLHLPADGPRLTLEAQSPRESDGGDDGDTGITERNTSNNTREQRHSSASHEALVARIQAGDVGAFRALYLEYYGSLVGFARGIVHTHDAAEDVVQQMFMELWERHEAWNPHRIGPALYRATRHRALDAVRDRRKLEALDDISPDVFVATTGSDERASFHELERVLARAVQALPERRRTALLLRAMRQLSYAEIGEILGVSEKAAFILVARARDALEPIRVRFLTATG